MSRKVYHLINPVFYVNQYSPFTSSFIRAIENLYNHIKDGIPDNNFRESDYNDILNSYRYMKNYEGDLKRNGIETIKYRFADECEWRYVPPMNLTLWPFVPADKFNTPDEKKKHNEKNRNIKLNFQPDDIRYIIVEKEEEILQLIKHLETEKGIHYDSETIRRLASRILTAEQIKNDI